MSKSFKSQSHRNARHHGRQALARGTRSSMTPVRGPLEFASFGGSSSSGSRSRGERTYDSGRHFVRPDEADRSCDSPGWRNTFCGRNRRFGRSGSVVVRQ